MKPGKPLERRTPLVAKTQLVSKKPMAQISPKKLAEMVAGTRPASSFTARSGELVRTSGLARGGPIKPKLATQAAVAKPKRPKYTGPDKETRDWVWERLGRTCVVPGCGNEATELHHRLRRGQGGDKRPFINSRPNLLPLCWRCNGDVECQPNLWATSGFYLRQGQWPYEYAVEIEGLGWMSWDLDADDWVSVFALNDWYTADRAGVTV